MQHAPEAESEKSDGVDGVEGASSLRDTPDTFPTHFFVSSTIRTTNPGFRTERVLLA